MTDVAGAAPAAAEPIATPQEAQPAPVEEQSEPAIDRSKETARHSLDRAFAEIDKQEASAAGKPAKVEPDKAVAPGRDEQGRFTGKSDAKAALLDLDPDALGKDGKPVTDAKQPVTTMEPPARFSPDAKAAWKDVPDPVKGEVGRAFRELETGLKEYQQVFEPLKPFYHLAQEKGVEIHEALKNYVAVDQALVSKDPQERLATIEHLLGIAGISPREYAAYISGQPADQTQTQNDRTISELRQEIAGLKNQLGGVTQTIAQRREDEALKEVQAFADANPRMKDAEFQKSVYRLLETRMAADLQSAFDMATRLNPPPVEAAQPAPSTGANPKPGAAQTRNGNLSVTGAPGSGSNPAKRKAPATARDSVDSAFASLGLG